MVHVFRVKIRRRVRKMRKCDSCLYGEKLYDGTLICQHIVSMQGREATQDYLICSNDLGISSMLSKTYRASKSGTEKVFSAASKSVSVARGVSADALNSAQTMCFMSSALDEAEEK